MARKSKVVLICDKHRGDVEAVGSPRDHHRRPAPQARPLRRPPGRGPSGRSALVEAVDQRLVGVHVLGPEPQRPVQRQHPSQLGDASEWAEANGHELPGRGSHPPGRARGLRGVQGLIGGSAGSIRWGSDGGSVGGAPPLDRRLEQFEVVLAQGDDLRRRARFLDLDRGNGIGDARMGVAQPMALGRSPPLGCRRPGPVPDTQGIARTCRFPAPVLGREILRPTTPGSWGPGGRSRLRRAAAASWWRLGTSKWRSRAAMARFTVDSEA